ncbi:hypothetical protein ACE1TI_19295, partial [Alteribacillus sp. JSM 102045]
ANLRFTRMSVRGKEKVENELGFAFMAVNLRKYTASTHHGPLNNNQKRFRLLKNDNRNLFLLFRASYVPAPFLLFRKLYFSKCG